MAGIIHLLRQYLIIFLLLGGVQLDAVAQSQDVIITGAGLVGIDYVHFNLPEDATAKLSIANTGGPPGEGLGNCGYVEAVFSVLGAIPDSDGSTVTRDGEPNIQDLELLHRQTVNLIPGQTKPITFAPNFTTSSVIFVTATRPEHKHCLRQSAVAVSSPIGFGYVGGGTNSEVVQMEYPLMDGGGGGGSSSDKVCCACAPVCACGLCDP
jgi:hypothetical protein